MVAAAQIKLLNTVLATGVGPEKTFNKLIDKHIMQVNVTGTPTAVTIDLQGSIDGTNFFVIATHIFSAAELTATGAIFIDVDMPMIAVRANLTTLTGGSTPAVTVKYEGLQTGDAKSGLKGAF